MTLIAVEPKARFDNTAVSSEIENGLALSMYASYACPTCGQVVQLTKQQLEEWSALRFSNLPGPVSALIDTWAAPDAGRGRVGPWRA